MDSPLIPETDLWETALELRRKGVPFVSCTVASTDRSAPRDAGARMIVRSDGSISGTVGGGPLEAVVIARAVELLASGQGTTLVSIPLSEHAPDSIGMKCGGDASVLLDPVPAPPRLIVLGAGHVGCAVAELAVWLGWRVHVRDDRPDRLSLAPAHADRRGFQVGHESQALADVAPDDSLVIVTRCHAVDEAMLQAALLTPARYVGLIGSKRKIAVVFRNIRERTGIDPSQQSRVHAPIGLTLGGKAPRDIALSIVGEVLGHRSGLSPAPGHRRLPPRR